MSELRGAIVRIYLAAFVNGLNEKYREQCIAEGKPKYLLESFYYRKHCEDTLKLVYCNYINSG